VQGDRCPTVTFEGAPDSVRGAFVFRNGLTEAIAREDAALAARLAPADQAACRIDLAVRR
jgi:hypothetical protein